MIPFFELPPIPIRDNLAIQPFGLLVVAAAWIFGLVARWRAGKVGLDKQILTSCFYWVIGGAFVTSHVVDLLFYRPEVLFGDPISLLDMTQGYSSFGGFVGGTITGSVFLGIKKIGIRQYADALVFGLVPAWIVARLGCTLTHDHPGKLSEFFLAVRYPGGSRHDLGFYELLFASVLTIVLVAAASHRPFPGFHTALVLLLYSPVRFFLDFLRVEELPMAWSGLPDPRYFGLTPGQYFAITMLGFALALIIYGKDITVIPLR